MQQTLKIEIDKKTIVSKPFDFEAMCLVNDVYSGATEKGYLSAGRAAVYYMFEETEATNDVLNRLSLVEMTKLCTQAWNFYAEAIKESTKNA